MKKISRTRENNGESGRGIMRAVRSVLLFGLLGIVSGLAIGLSGEWAFGRSSDLEGSLDRLAMRPDRDVVEAVSVGHSRSRAVDFDALGLRGHSLWIGGADIFESAEIVHALLDDLPGLQVVFLTADFMSFSVDHAAGSEGSAARIGVYGALGPTALIGADVENWLRARFRLLARTDGWNPARLCVLRGSHDCDGGEASPPSDPFADAERRVRLHLARRLPGVEASALRTLRRLATQLQERAIGLILHAPPVSHAYAQALESRLNVAEERRGIDEALDALDAENPCVIRARPSLGAQFVEDPRLFRDADHLSASGAALYSRHLSGTVRRLVEECEPNPPHKAAGPTPRGG